MNYHDITKDDMKNGPGLRVVLWVAGCNHHCKGCQNPITWDPDDGLPFTKETKKELFDELDKSYISGITFSGGDPLHPKNVSTIYELSKEIKELYPNKTIWLYTGYTFDEITENKQLTELMKYIDVIVDGKFIEEKADITYPWGGSVNQRVVDIKKSFAKGDIVRYGTDNH